MTEAWASEETYVGAAGAQPAAQQLPYAWRTALAEHDAAACHALATQASARRDSSAVAGLCALVAMPVTLRQSLLGRRKAWRWARIAAITALARIGAREALPCLAQALFDSDPHVRETVAFELPTFGSTVAPILRQILREAPDWSLAGMRELIDILGKVGDPTATGELTQLLAERLPGDPSRWARQTFARPFYLVVGLFLTLWIATLFTMSSADPSIPRWASGLEAGISLGVGGFVPFLFLYMLLVCLVFLPLLNLSAVRERGAMAQSTLEALSRLHDKRPLPVVIDIAFGPRPRLARAARKTLCSLLPLLEPSDASHLPLKARQQLAQALGTEPELDLTLLRALEHVGTGEAARSVERLTRLGANGEIRQQAHRLLPLLRERRRCETASASLLRASLPSAAPGELLRAAEQSPGAPVEQLLHPAGGVE